MIGMHQEGKPERAQVRSLSNFTGLFYFVNLGYIAFFFQMFLSRKDQSVIGKI
jgi:hypothetical protein